MIEIAKQHRVDWTPDMSMIVDPLAPMAAPTGVSVSAAGGSGPDFAALYAAQSPDLGAPPSAFPTVPTSSRSTTSPDRPTSRSTTSSRSSQESRPNSRSSMENHDQGQ